MFRLCELAQFLGGNLGQRPVREIGNVGESIQRNPSISQGVIGLETKESPALPADLFVYVMATNTLYQITSTPLVDESLNDISVLPNGDIRVVWAANDGPGGESNVYATTFTPAGAGDFSFSGIVPMTIAAGGSASTTVTVDPVNGFSAVVNLSVSGQPAGVTTTLSPNSVTLSGGNSATSALNVSAASFVVPTNFTLTVTGASGALSHSATANVSVTATTTSTSNSIGDMLNAGCIDNAGIGNALTSKLSAAQSAGNVQTAINTLTALKNQIQAQAGKHIHTACTIGGVTFNPVNVLLLDVQALIDSLRVSLIPDPITGYVVDGSGVGLAGATVSVINSGGTVVVTATTDITGFYFLATTGVLTPGASYTIAVTGLPAGFANVTPPNQAFTWQGSVIAFGNFVLN
ncbi:MAG TPA: carboxypeptidase-like regulatory domain-containing protein [Candidatus Acidoferrum sp.]|nr:carboxypeptidase-like regulatory domain-containing protein [Candidatus Acidoferrum sp.]